MPVSVRKHAPKWGGGEGGEGRHRSIGNNVGCQSVGGAAVWVTCPSCFMISYDALSTRQAQTQTAAALFVGSLSAPYRRVWDKALCGPGLHKAGPLSPSHSVPHVTGGTVSSPPNNEGTRERRVGLHRMRERSSLCLPLTAR